MSDRGPIHVDDETRLADEMARELESVAEQSHVAPPAGFTDRVMASIAGEPLPQPARAFGTAVAGRRLGAALASIGDAWRVVVGGRAPIAVRAQALALVLVVTVGSLAVAGGAAVGAIDLFDATQAPHPSPTEPQPSSTPERPSPSSSPSPSVTTPPPAEPTPTSEGGDTPEATDTGAPTERPASSTPRPTRTEDAGGGTPTPTATETDDHGGDGSGGGGQTPQPTGTDDHGSGGHG